MNQEITEAAPYVDEFKLQLPATRRNARLARRLAVAQLLSWRLPLDQAQLVIAELVANAAVHGRVGGRDFRLRMAVTESGTLRIEVTDPRGDRPLPEGAGLRTVPSGGEESGEEERGRGLLLVEALADRWGVVDGPVPCKTVWAECGLVGGDV
ncbi:ATP-binding protein [Streptomyces sp. NA04227]|uniref:ATP-binding protein n=1 Tax=Streptomyces sp. NA04227 TaxID=2742136 RepID=UPI0015904E99|nr:ATP-binding protein [Streptomyces sp. NA04227]QKW08523.1 ATP-binding protein [Streptomyces sp. NA04227]